MSTLLVQSAFQQKESEDLLERYGDQLLCVRYRYDPYTQQHYKTVELIIETLKWEDLPVFPAPNTLVELALNDNEIELKAQVKRAGGKWNPQRQVWELAYADVEVLGLTHKIAGTNTIYH